MLAKASAWLRQRAPFLFEEKMPVWLTIAVGFLVGIITYIATPIVNREFDLDKSRSHQTSKTIEGLNGQIISLSKSVRRLTNSLVNSPEKAPAIREQCLDTITEMQWRLIDLRVVLTDDGDLKEVDRLSTSLKALQDAISSAPDRSAEPRILKAMGMLGHSTEEVLNRLYRKANLKY